MSDAYSTLKILHHPEKVAALRAGGVVIPAQVQIIMSDWCPQHCGFCAYRMEGYTSNALFGVEKDGVRNNNPYRMIPGPKVREILYDCAQMGVSAIQFTGGGEPTAHPGHAEAWRYALDLGLEIALVTNGVMLSESDIDLLLEAAWVRISIDAGDEHTYAAVRGVPRDQYHKALASMRTLCQRKEATGAAVVIGCGFVMTPDNWTEVVDATRKAKALGADNIRISAMFSTEDEKPYLPFYEQAKLLIGEARKLGSETFAVYDRFGDRVSDLTAKSPDYKRCGYQHFTTYIGGDQNVYRCCNTAYNDQGLLGSIADRSFAEFWSSEEVQRSLHEFQAPSCQRCQFNQINRVIDYATQSHPLHAAFV